LKKALVTGGSGFIGINLIDSLLKQDYEVINIDIAETPNKDQARLLRKIDINNYEDLYNEINVFQPEIVFHLAARTDLNSNNIKEYKTNYEGTNNLIKIINLIPSIKNVIYFSSMLVCKSGYVPITDIDYLPDTTYGESKVLMEKLIRNSQHKFAKWIIVRPTSIWGPWFKEPYRNFFDLLIKNKFVDIGSRSCTKTYGYVENTVFQTLKLLEDSGSNKKTYYLGDYDPIFISDWANEISMKIREKRVIRLPFIVFQIAAFTGDILKRLKISFPLTTFRLNNMTKNNIVNLDATEEISGPLPIKRDKGIELTLNWLKKHN
jgi:GlcNAc-P-P-Und epimerase